jgi:hypothetical protein
MCPLVPQTEDTLRIITKGEMRIVNGAQQIVRRELGLSLLCIVNGAQQRGTIIVREWVSDAPKNHCKFAPSVDD